MKLLGGCIRCGVSYNTFLHPRPPHSPALTFCKHRVVPSNRTSTECRRRQLQGAASVTVQDPQLDTRTVPAATQLPKPAFKAFLDFKALKADLEKHVQNCQDRKSTADPAKVVSLYDQFCEAQQQVDSIREERNSNAKAMKVQVLLAQLSCQLECTAPFTSCSSM